ncbi:hypothetical protein WKV44_00685 [Spirochaetia bacterium 38H-sp]|uniref:Cytoplasmic protein n=1 Tax=Rarispira pelagica TaxID=3141764 RepID=A0ABU9U8Q9_9SPIR
MVKSLLVKRSPLRILSKSIHGGLKPGEIGIIAGKKGIGKTACLVHIATDKLFQDKHVIHISYANSVQHLLSWYEDIFREISKKRNLEDAMDVHEEIIRNRVILNFHKDGARTEHVISTLKALKQDGAFKVDQVVIDGLDASVLKKEDIEKFKQGAKELGISIWFSISTESSEPTPDSDGFPVELTQVKELTDILLYLIPQNNHISIHLLKDREAYKDIDLHLILEPNTLLVVEE